jgi:hypothetical protein
VIPRWPSHLVPVDESPTTCILRLDRAIVCADEWQREAIRTLPGYSCVKDHRLRTGLYERCIVLKNVNGTRISCEYGRRVPWIPKLRVTWDANDKMGLQQPDLLPILELVSNAKLVLIELAFDFAPDLHINCGFVLAHFTFGKSRFHGKKPGIVWFGTRRSTTFVRAYWKDEIDAFRVELEFHSRWLRQHSIRDTFDFGKLPDLIVRRHIGFCRLNWAAIYRAIRGRCSNWRLALRNLQWQRHDLHSSLRFLRREVGLPNTHRFLIPLETSLIGDAFSAWARHWPKCPFRLRTPATPFSPRQWKRGPE